MYCCAVPVVPHIALSFSLAVCLSCIRIHDFRKKFTSSNLRVELALAANVVLSGRAI